MLTFTTDNVQAQLTKESADPFDSSRRKSDRSLPVSVPSTPEMDELFVSAFEINRVLGDTDWNPNHKAVAQLISSDGIVLLRGYAQLIDITTEDETIVYNVVLYGVVKDLFTNIGEKLMIGNEDTADDLDFSEYTHTFGQTDIAASWEFDCKVNTVSTDLTGEGKGYLYPMMDTGANNADMRKFKTEDWRPSLYWYEILLKIFEKAGMTWSSDFLESAMFKRLTLPFMGEQMYLDSDTMIEQSASAIRITSPQEVTFYNTPSGNGNPDRSTGDKAIFNSETSDPSSQYNPSNGEFTALDDMEVVVEGQIIGYIKYVAAATKQYPANADHDHYGNIHFEIIKDTGGGSYDPVSLFTCRTFFNNLTTSGTLDDLPQDTFSDIITGEGYFQSTPIKLKAGDKLYIKFNHYQDDYFGAWYTQAHAFISQDSFVNFLRTSSVVTGQLLDPTICLPNEKQVDFVKRCIKRFNLFLDPIDEHVLTIEPRDDFYISETENWERYRATDRELIFEPMALLNAKQYDFVHEKEDDTLNKQYFSKYGYTYGRKRLYTENEFLTEVKEINDGIAPTPSVSQIDRIIPSMVYLDSSGQIINKSSKPRMLYYGGLKDCATWYNVENGVETAYTQYPYSGMQDDPFDPTLTLTWGIQNEVYYKQYPSNPAIKASTNDLYGAYWRNTIEQITNKDSRVVTGWFWLDPVRYYSATFRKQYWFNNAYHRLLKIEDYVASDDISLTKCVFLKLQRVTLPEVTQHTITGGKSTGGGTGSGNGGVIDNTRISDRARGAMDGSGPGGGISTGSGGVISPMRYMGLVNAPETQMGVSAIDVTVLGKGNNIFSGQRNITHINSDLECPMDDVVVVNNLITKCDTIEVDSTALGGIDTTPLMLILNQMEGSVIAIDSVYGVMKFDTAGYEDRTLDIINDTGDIIYTFGTGFTNQGSDKRMEAQRNSFELRVDENIYIESDGDLSTGSGSLFLVINYKIIQL